jgi:hypothetical protein
VASFSIGASSKILTSLGLAEEEDDDNRYAFIPPDICLAIPDGHTSMRDPLHASL